jgi:TetR/AcrR family transcriptional regulator, transcriptional repressor for nem operon
MESTRGHLKACALRLFLASGYGAVGTADICRAASANKGTFYHYFPSKAALLVELIDDYAAAFDASFRAVAQSKRRPELKLRDLFAVPEKANRDWCAEHGKAQGCLVGNMAMEVSASEPEVNAAVRRAIDLWRATITPVVRQAMPGAGRRHAESVAMLVIAAMQGALMLSRAFNDAGHIRGVGRLLCGPCGLPVGGKAPPT